MRIGINGNRLVRLGNLQTIREHALGVAQDGFAGYWLSQDPVGGFDTLTALAALAQDIPQIELGTCVVPTWPRHPAVLAAQSLTVDQIAQGRLRLGIGLSHAAFMRQLGIEYAHPADHMQEFLSILMPLLAGDRVDFVGERLSCHTSMLRIEKDPPPVLVAALGPRMLDLAGQLTDGTIVTWTGPKSIREHVRPRLEAAAEKAGRPRPHVVAVVSVGVADDAEAARNAVDAWFAAHGESASYNAMLAREGVERAADVQAVGQPDQIVRRLEEYLAAGVDEFVVGEVATTPDEQAKTRALLQSLHTVA